MPVQSTSPSSVAGSRGTPCPRSRDGLPDRDDVPDNVRRVPAQWVRPRRPRLAMLVSWPGMVRSNLGRNSWRSARPALIVSYLDLVPKSCEEAFSRQPTAVGPLLKANS